MKVTCPMVSYYVSDGHGLTTRASCDFIKVKPLFHFFQIVNKMDFKTLSGNGYVYFQESGIVTMSRFNLLGRNKKLKVCPSILQSFHFSLEKLLMTCRRNCTKKGGIEMIPSTWCVALYAGNNGGFIRPLPGCDRKPLAEG